MKLLRGLKILLLTPALLLAFAWAFGALFYDGPAKWLAALQAAAIVGVLIFVRPWRRALGIFAGWFALVLGWWLMQRPTNDAEWQPDVNQLARAEVNGDEVTLHNVRNCEYRTETDYTPRWETRTVRLSQMTGIDLAIAYWGSPWMAHPLVSFQFADAPPVVMSIETRKKVGQTYSAIGGIYRQFQLIYLMLDERDALRVRTNYRKGEDVYLYRTAITPERARERFMEYVRSINAMQEQPRWYNAITTNCTTAIRTQHPPGERMPWNWRMLANGKADEMLYLHGVFVTEDLPFAELKQRALINPAAHAADADPDFSRRIREGRPGFSSAGRLPGGNSESP